MTKIIGLVKPFELYQILYVYENGNNLDLVKIKSEEIPEAIANFINKYNIDQVDLLGAKHYSQGIKEQILNYINKDLTINCI